MKSKLIFLMLINILLGESIFSPKEFKARRLKLAKKMELGSIAILQGAPSETGYVKFRQYNEFYYLTGIETPHSYVIIKGQTGETTLYLPNKNNRRERSEGPLLSAEDVAEVKALNNVDQVASVEMMGEHLWRMRMSSSRGGDGGRAISSRASALSEAVLLLGSTLPFLKSTKSLLQKRF